MAKFVKEILRPGTYYVNVVGGRRRKETFSKERISNFVKQHEAMLKAGLKIPSPWKHALEALPATATPGDKPLHPGDAFANSKENAGFWSRLFQDKRGVLYGELDVENQADADKIGTSVQEVSPFIKTEFEDGLQRKWNDSVLHIALVTNPVMPGQRNFEKVAPPVTPAASTPGSTAPASEHGIALSLSGFLAPPNVEVPDSVLMSMDRDEAEDTPAEEMPEETPADSPNPSQTAASGATIQDALNALREIGLDLPEDTHEANLVERIVVASRAISTATGAGQQQQQDPNAQPQEMPTPVAMSHTQGAAAVAANANPNITVDERVATFAIKQARKSYVSRIENLIASGRISAAYRDQHLSPLLDGFQLSLDEAGAPTPTAIDHLLDALEAIPSSSTLNGGTVTTRKDGKVNVKKEGRTVALSLAEEPLPAEYEADPSIVTDEDADRVVQEMFRNTGRIHNNHREAAAAE